MISNAIWIPCLAISVCLSAVFVAILVEHRKDGSYLVDALLTRYLSGRREPSPGEKRLVFMSILPKWFMQSSRKSQEHLISIITVTASIIGAMFLHTLVTIFGYYANDASAVGPVFATLPIFAIFGYLMGRRVVAPRVIYYCSDWLNPD